MDKIGRKGENVMTFKLLTIDSIAESVPAFACNINNSYSTTILPYK